MPNPTWFDLFSTGSLCDLDISLWHGLVRLKPKDLGIESTQEVRTALTFGHERLLPKRVLQPIFKAAAEARKAVEFNSINFPLVPGSRFVPKNRRRALDRTLDDCRKEFQRELDVLVKSYDQERQNMQPVLERALTDAAKDTGAVQAAMDRVNLSYPGADALRNNFSIGWKFFAIASAMDGSPTEDAAAVKEVIGDLVKKLRAEVTDKADDILGLVARGGKLTQKTYNSALKVCERLESVNILGDRQLDAAVKAIREAVRQASSADTDKAGEILVNGLGPLKEQLEKSREEAAAEAADRICGLGKRRLL